MTRALRRQGEASATVVETIRMLMIRKGVNIEEVAAATRFAPSVLYKRMNGTSEWKLEELSRIADYFNVSLGFLVTGFRTDSGTGAFNPPYLRDETTLPDDSAPYETIDLREHQPTDPTCVPPSRDPGRTVKRRRTLRRRGTRPTDNRPPREATRNAA